MRFLENDLMQDCPLFDESDVGDIIFSSSKLKNMYLKGILKTGISLTLGWDVHDTLRCVGTSCMKPNFLIDLYKHLIHLKGGNCFNYLSIRQDGDDILLLFSYSGSNTNLEICRLMVEDLGGGRYSYEEDVDFNRMENGEPIIEYCNNDIVFSKLLYKAISECIRISPEKVYSIEYVLEECVKYPDYIGKGIEFFVGFCEATKDNIGYIDLQGLEDCRGEFSVVFFERNA